MSELRSLSVRDFPRIFIGYDAVEAVAHNVLVHSIQSRATVPVQITQVANHQLTWLFKRKRDPLQSNDFSFTRWLVPYLCGYRGWALWMDCDMLVLDDISNLWDLRDDRFAAQVVKHNHVPKCDEKYLGRRQLAYYRKNWSSLMLLNCEKCRKLTPDYVHDASGLELHQFNWCSDNEIGDLPMEWNFLVGHNTGVDLGRKRLKNIHYTEGGPYFKEYEDCEYAGSWFYELHDMLKCAQSSLDGYTL